MIVGLALAVACAVATSVAFLFKRRGAVLAPPVRVRHPLRSAVDLFRSKWFAVGWAGCFTWARSRWRHYRSCRPSSRAGWLFLMTPLASSEILRGLPDKDAGFDRDQRCRVHVFTPLRDHRFPPTPEIGSDLGALLGWLSRGGERGPFRPKRASGYCRSPAAFEGGF
jgi:hypothetical protein